MGRDDGDEEGGGGGEGAFLTMLANVCVCADLLTGTDGDTVGDVMLGMVGGMGEMCVRDEEEC